MEIRLPIESPNVLLETIQKNGKPIMRSVICDFGLARTSTGNEVPNLMVLNIQGMSPRYTAPEVFSRFKSNSNLGDRLSI